MGWEENAFCFCSEVRGGMNWAEVSNRDSSDFLLPRRKRTFLLNDDRAYGQTKGVCIHSRAVSTCTLVFLFDILSPGP